MTSPIFISVIICTHNPCSDYISRVLDRLASQTLSQDTWELLLVDNASEKILSTEIDLSWHPHSRHIREEELGLTRARLRGIKESVADILVFVDDDNILDVNYLEVALQISKDYPIIGAWGGQILPEFEAPPEAWAKPYLWMLAIKELEYDRWSNIPYLYDSVPNGAGLCVKRSVAEKYSSLTTTEPQRLNLDRKGQSLISCGDVDLACTACDIGLGTGLFTSLKLTHLIPPNRLKEDYLLKLAEASGYSSVIVESLRGKYPNLPPTTPLSKMRKIYQRLRNFTRPSSDIARINQLFLQSFERGHSRAVKEIHNPDM
jgi:glycosyltransferase involved in cell wall biosynthesis